MEADAAILDRLDALIAATQAAALPFEKRWLTAREVGALTGYSERQVLESLACLAGFPEPVRINNKGHPRWRAVEVDTWMVAQRDAPKKGRPRKSA